ncbi:hypothetical protein ATY78_23695 [Rhizobium sp. R635]|nr:hypothetical protein ATY78_23695 [Rhizobium sp. R635]
MFKLINNAVSRALLKFVRDDIISAMCLAVVDGQLFIENIGKEASKFVVPTIASTTTSRLRS